MFATEIDLGDDAPDPRLVRWELFLFRDVRDVLPGTRPGTMLVIHTGPACSELWLAELREAGLVRPRAPRRPET